MLTNFWKKIFLVSIAVLSQPQRYSWTLLPWLDGTTKKVLIVEILDIIIIFITEKDENVFSLELSQEIIKQDLPVQSIY